MAETVKRKTYDSSSRAGSSRARRHRILQAAGTDVSAAELAEQVGMSRVGVRRYLEHLVDIGRATLTPRYGGGRPENRYSAAS